MTFSNSRQGQRHCRLYALLKNEELRCQVLQSEIDSGLSGSSEDGYMASL